MRHVPNVLTLLRVVLSLMMFAALATVAGGLGPSGFGPETGVHLAQFAFVAFVIAAATDFFDGWLARRLDAVSTFGAILDPIGDKVLVCGAILGLLAAQTPYIVIPGGVILFREFAVSALRETLAPRGVKLPVTFLAKIKTSLQLVALGALMAMQFWPVWRIQAPADFVYKAMVLAQALFALSAIVTVWTGVEYALAARKALARP